ncbi:MAG: hypothetical protein ABL962_21625, partial [Fimbriimonadaceae bacterium]
MATITRLWIPGVVLGLAMGCGGPDYAGFYTGQQKFTGDDPVLAATIGLVELDLKRDGRFSLRRLSVFWEGRWSSEEGNVKLRIETSMGRDVIDGGLVPSRLSLAVESAGKLRFIDGNGQTPESK